jgi:CBS domain-containing protein
MSIGKICETKVITATKDMMITEAAQVMKEHNIGSIVVVEQQQSSFIPIGMLTDRDIVTKVVTEDLDLDSVTVGDVMNGELLLLKKHQSIQEAIDMMSAKGVRRVPVIDDNNVLIGVFSVDDLFILLADEIQSVARLIRKQICS